MSDYTDEYIEKVFYAWYEGGRKQGNEFVNALPKCAGQSPTKKTIQEWKNTNGWVERADALDAEVSVALDREVIERRKKMYEEQARVGDELVKQGMAFLTNEGIKNDASAIRAIDLGLSTQRISTGMAEAYLKISSMSDDQLTSSIQKLLGKTTTDTVDAEILDEE